MGDYKYLFKPISEALTRLQKENLHLTNFYTEWLKIKLITLNIITSTRRPFLKKLTKCFQKTFIFKKKLLDNNGVICALLFDPRYNHVIMKNQTLLEREQKTTFTRSTINKKNKKFE